MKIVFPVAGVGTRFLPATKEVPKEILPVIDKPLIQYAVEEAVQSGLADFVFITARGKEALERYFAPNRELDDFLKRHRKTHLLDGLQEFYQKNFTYIRQEQALGFGHAIALAEKAVGDEAFAISLPDDLILSRRPVMAQLLEVYEKYQSPVIAFMEVPRADIPRYGIAAGTFIWRSGSSSIEKLVEKPAAGRRPLQLRRHRPLHPDPRHLPAAASATGHGAGSEIQLTDAVVELMKKRQVLGYFFEGRRFDAGTTLGYIETLIHVALQRRGHARLHPPASCATWPKMRNYETFSTTADIGHQRSAAAISAELYENALRGLERPPFRHQACRERRRQRQSPFRFRGDGPENVLVNLLAEVLSLAYQQKKRVAAIEIRQADSCSLDAQLLLAPIAAARRRSRSRRSPTTSCAWSKKTG